MMEYYEKNMKICEYIDNISRKKSNNNHVSRQKIKYFCLFRGKLVLGYTEVELVTPGSGYQFIHAADMMYCADNHLRSE